MTSNDGRTLRVGFDPAINNQYPLSIYIVDDRGYQTCLHVRKDWINILMSCLWCPMYPAVRFVTMTGDYVVKWWNYHEVAFINDGTRLATVLQLNEAMELVRLVLSEMGGKKMPVIHLKAEEVGVGIDGRLDSPVRLKLGDLDSSFGIKTADAHKLIVFVEKRHANEANCEELTIESTRGTLAIQFIEKEELAIENADDRMLMILDKDCFEELHRLLTLTVPKLQEFIEKNWTDSVNKQRDDNLRGLFG